MPVIPPDRFPRTALPPLAQALVIRALREIEGGVVSGAQLVSIRRSVLAGAHDKHPEAARHKAERARLMAVRKENMPPASDDVWLMVETLSQRLGAAGHAEAWREIGISPRTGRGLLARNADNVTWPIWFTLRVNALGV